VKQSLLGVAHATWLGVNAAVRVLGMVAGDGVKSLLEESSMRFSSPLALDDAFAETQRSTAQWESGRRGLPPAVARPETSSADHDASLAIAIAFTCIRYLSRVPGLPWRNSCLFRAAAECWILRTYHLPAVMRIGVTRRPANDAHGEAASPGAVSAPRAEPPRRLGGDVAAHAWVECAGVRCRTALGGERDTYALLESRT
jgi:hypothetical protein